jgi:tryptophan synthase alpha chain
LKEKQIDTIYLVAPTTPEKRIKHIVQSGSGYVYYVSLKGVTGASHLDLENVSSRLKLIRKYTELPIAVGFGISSKETAVSVANTIADGVIIGSALIKIMESVTNENKCPIKEASNFIEKLSEAIKKV